MSHRVLRILYLIVPLALVAAFIFRPTPILGVDGESLAASVGVPVNELNSVPCEDKGDDKWLCTDPGQPNPELGEAGPTTYEVKVDTWGCWNMGAVQGPAEPAETESCVTMMDHIESID